MAKLVDTFRAKYYNGLYHTFNLFYKDDLWYYEIMFGSTFIYRSETYDTFDTCFKVFYVHHLRDVYPEENALDLVYN